MSKQYDIRTHGADGALRRGAPSQEPVERPDPLVRNGALLCVVGGLVTAVGAVWAATRNGVVSPDRLSYPFDVQTFRITEIVWSLAHLLALAGAVALLRSGLVGRSRLGRVGLGITLAGMALLVPAEFGFAVIADAALDSPESAALGAGIGLAVTLSGIGFTLTGIRVVRERLWIGWGRWTPLLCGVFVLAVLLPVQAAAPSLFLWPVAGWSACLALFGWALARRT
jgi:hypothetical protein